MNFCPECGAKKSGKFCESCGYKYPDVKPEPRTIEVSRPVFEHQAEPVSQGSPAWFPDPIRSGRERLWDGSQWTDEVRPGPKGQARNMVRPGESVPRPHLEPISKAKKVGNKSAIAIEVPEGLIYGSKFNAKKNCLNCGFKLGKSVTCELCGYGG